MGGVFGFPFGNLEESELGRRGLFEELLGQRFSGAERERAGSLFQPIFGQFLGQITSELRAGQSPNTTFENFLGNFDFDRELVRQPRAGNQSVLGRGRTQFNFGQGRSQGFF